MFYFNDALNLNKSFFPLTGGERSLVVRSVVGSIFHGGPIELFLVPAGSTRLV